MNLDWLPKDAAKWIGIIIGAGVLITLLFPKMNCGGTPGTADTVFVPVQSLPDTITVPVVVLTPVVVQDTSRIDSLKRLILGKDYATALANKRADSLFNELLTVREGTILVDHRDSDYVLIGKIPVDYDPIGHTFGASLIVDSLSMHVLVPPAPTIGIQPVQVVGGVIFGWFLAILMGVL